MTMNLSDRYALSLLTISLACPLVVSFTPLPLVVLGAIAQTTMQNQVSDKQPITLSLQKSITRELKGGETHSNVVSLKAGQFFRRSRSSRGLI